MTLKAPKIVGSPRSIHIVSISSLTKDISNKGKMNEKKIERKEGRVEGERNGGRAGREKIKQF